MKRKEIYALIKTLGIEDALNTVYNDSYTRVSTDLLKKYILTYYLKDLYNLLTVPQLLDILIDNKIITKENIMKNIANGNKHQ